MPYDANLRIETETREYTFTEVALVLDDLINVDVPYPLRPPIQRPLGSRKLNRENILKVADFIEKKVQDHEFSMSSWCTCIAGQCVRMLNGGIPRSGGVNTGITAAQYMGLNHQEASHLFCVLPMTRTGAVQTLRHLAHTGHL